MQPIITLNTMKLIIFYCNNYSTLKNTYKCKMLLMPPLVFTIATIIINLILLILKLLSFLIHI